MHGKICVVAADDDLFRTHAARQGAAADRGRLSTEQIQAIERRRQSYAVDMTQVPSLVRPPGYEPPVARWREAGEDHRVRLEEPT